MKLGITKRYFHMGSDNRKLLIIVLITSIIRCIQMPIYFSFFKSEMIGPLNYLGKTFPQNNDLVMTESNRILSNLPIMKIAYSISTIIGYATYENIQYFLISCIFFIGIYRLCLYFNNEIKTSLIFAIIISLISTGSSLLLFSYQFMPSAAGTLGALAQSFLPLLIYYLISRQFKMLIILFVVLTIFHPANGLNFGAFSIVYILFSKDVNTRTKISSISFISVLMLVVTLYIKGTQPHAPIPYEMWKKITLLVSAHPYTWMFMNKVASFANVLVLVWSMYYLLIKKKLCGNLIQMRYLLTVSTGYLLLAALIAIIADIFGLINVLAFYPSRLTFILVIVYIVQVSVWFTHYSKLDGIRLLPVIITSILGFYFYSFLLWFIFIYDIRFVKDSKYKGLIYFVVIFVLSGLRYSSEYFITFYLVPSTLYPAIIWLVTTLFAHACMRANIEKYRVTKNISVLFVLCVIVSLSVSFALNARRITLLRDERKVVSVIMKTPSDSVFLYLTPEYDPYNVVFFIENAHLRNALPGMASIASIIYASSLGQRIISDVQYVYGVNLLDAENKQGKNPLFFLYENYVSKFSAADWLRIKERYPSFRYVLTSAYLSEVNEIYLKKMYNDSSFNIYEIQWDKINYDYYK